MTWFDAVSASYTETMFSSSCCFNLFVAQNSFFFDAMQFVYWRIRTRAYIIQLYTASPWKHAKCCNGVEMWKEILRLPLAFWDFRVKQKRRKVLNQQDGKDIPSVLWRGSVAVPQSRAKLQLLFLCFCGTVKTDKAKTWSKTETWGWWNSGAFWRKPDFKMSWLCKVWEGHETDRKRFMQISTVNVGR